MFTALATRVQTETAHANALEVTTPGRILHMPGAAWWNRPDDERYPDIDALLRAVTQRAEASEERIVDHHSIRVELPQQNDPFPKGPIQVTTPHAWGAEGLTALELTDWSFGQLCSRAKVGRKIVQQFSNGVPHGRALMSCALNEGLKHLADRQQTMIYARTDADRGQLVALTGPTYGRILDRDVVEMVADTLGDEWTVPVQSMHTHDPARATTLYSSDRNTFMFLVNEARAIEVSTPHGRRTLYQGIMVWNSEAGAKSFGYQSFVYDWACDNRMIVGAHLIDNIAFRHSSGAPTRFRTTVRKALDRFSTSGVQTVRAHLEAAARFEAAKTDDDALAFLRNYGFTNDEAQNAVTRANEEEGGARTVWQLANGATASARAVTHQDRRIRLEEMAGNLLRAVA